MLKWPWRICPQNTIIAHVNISRSACQLPRCRIGPAWLEEFLFLTMLWGIGIHLLNIDCSILILWSSTLPTCIHIIISEFTCLSDPTSMYYFSRWRIGRELCSLAICLKQKSVRCDMLSIQNNNTLCMSNCRQWQNLTAFQIK